MKAAALDHLLRNHLTCVSADSAMRQCPAFSGKKTLEMISTRLDNSNKIHPCKAKMKGRGRGWREGG